MGKPKRIVVLSDTHCGHRVGLTPPAYQMAPQNAERRKWGNAQKKLWGFFAEQIDSLRPIDVLICNGDMIDGRGERSGGTELAFPGCQEQIEVATECVQFVGAKQIIITRGTDYHTGQVEEWEDELARDVGAVKIGNHEWVNVNGLILDCKHHCGSSQIPHGRHTAVARERMWNLLWAERGQAEQADIIVRSHVHYFSYCGGDGWLAMTTPSLQGLGSRYGSKRCSGTVDFGLISIDVWNKEEYTWEAHVTRLAQKSRAIRL